jgi:hypothetical protein
MALFALIGFIGYGFNRRFEGISDKFKVVFEEFGKYQSEKVCIALMTTEKERSGKNATDINRLGGKVDKIKRKVCH